MKAVMSGQELQEHIQALGLTQAEAAQLLGISPRTVTRWCTEGEEVSGPAEAALRAWRRLDARHLAWRPDSVSIVEDDAERIATHRQEAINLDDILRRVEARGGPQLSWAVSLPESEATLDRIHVSSVLGHVSPGSFRSRFPKMPIPGKWPRWAAFRRNLSELELCRC